MSGSNHWKCFDLNIKYVCKMFSITDFVNYYYTYNINLELHLNVFNKLSTLLKVTHYREKKKTKWIYPLISGKYKYNQSNMFQKNINQSKLEYDNLLHREENK